MSDYLPADVVFEILLRLPAKSLSRFKCVCKSWYDLISDSIFLFKCITFDSRTNNDHPYLLIKHEENIPNEPSFSMFSRYTLDSGACAALDYPFTDLSIYAGATKAHIDFSLVGSINGVVCLYDRHREHTLLWNPATNELKVLPQSQVSYPPDADPFLCQLMFGFSDETNDYKVVKILDLRLEDAEKYGPPDLRVEVYSLSSDSWKQVGRVVPNIHKPIFALSYPTTTFYWWQDDNGVPQVEAEAILWFDFNKEEAQIIPLPDMASIIGRGRIALRLTILELKGHVAMIFLNCPHSENDQLHLWVMLECGVKHSWTKFLSVNVSTQVDCVLGICNNTQLFLSTVNNGVLVYDLSAREIHHLNMSGSCSDFYFDFVPHFETFVPINAK